MDLSNSTSLGKQACVCFPNGKDCIEGSYLQCNTNSRYLSLVVSLEWTAARVFVVCV